MVDITKEQLSQLSSIVKTANSCGIEELVIENNMIRGITNSSIILFNYDEPSTIKWSFPKFATNRLSLFVNRLNTLDGDVNVYATATLKNEQFVMSFQIKSSRMKIDFRCTDPSVVEGQNKDRMPKSVSELNNLCYSINITDEFLTIYSKGLSAMKADSVRFISNKDGVLSIEFEDVNGDKFVCIVGKSYITNNELVSSIEFNFKYDAKTLQPLLKQNTSNKLSITKRGLLKCVVNNLSFLIPPEVK